MLRVLLIIASLPVVVWGSGYDSCNVLSNGGFEKGDLSEAANDAMGRYPWFSGNSGGNTIAAWWMAPEKNAPPMKSGESISTQNIYAGRIFLRQLGDEANRQLLVLCVGRPA